MDKRYDELFNFIHHGSYPVGSNKTQRLSLRRYVSKFTLREGQLFFAGTRRAVKSKEDTRRLFIEFHNSPLGGHGGIVRTLKAMCSRFYWHGMSVDIEQWILECDKCQKVGKPLTSVQPLQCIKVSAVWELTNDNIKRALKKLVNDKQDNWDVFLEATLFSLRSKVQTTTKYSPFQLMYGREAVFPSEVPVDMPLSNIILPGEASYGAYVTKKKGSKEATEAKAAENIAKAQEKQQEASAKKVHKKHQRIVYRVGD
ncbi:hypothetical protein AALO_G00223980 [Alosa alosa]|uniref:Gypsy retrotransposon integrase-like protein 1 n=1 Tax=Alosa alosa TaxID=278164 RepID=A0AAV6FYK7_9TELE|nr:hypothetical protein AALO_G00223980 [Alosa alosa]